MAENTRQKTAAETAFGATFDAAAAMLPGDATVRDLRARAFAAFDAIGLPNRRVEDWKYTDLRAALGEAQPLAEVPSSAAVFAGRDAGKMFDAVHVTRLLLINGTLVKPLSDLAEMPAGVSIVPMAEALANGHPLVRERLGRLASAGNAAIDLNTAFMGDGVIIHVAAGAQVVRPILIAAIHVGAASATFTRCLVVAEEGSSLTLVESGEGPSDVAYQSNLVTELFAGRDAKVELVRLQAEGSAALHLTTTLVEAAAGSSVSVLSLDHGAALARHQIGVTATGDHVKVAVRGASLLRGRQHADTTLVIEHQGTHGESRELLRTVLDDESHGVFQGKIIVRADAQKTDGKMASNALLLGSAAEMSNKPELEIYADDVVCGHGATSGQLDAELLFYLRARGIPLPEAEALLIQSFVGEVIDYIDNEPLRDAMADEVQRWLSQRARG